MPGVSEEQIARAKEVDLLSYMLAYERDNLVRQGSDRYVLRNHDSFVISNGKWRWNSRDYGRKTATALSYLMDVRGIGFTEAVEILSGERAASIPAYQPPPPKKRAFYPPKAQRYATNAVSYLQKRGIHPDIIGKCIRSGTLYESRYNGMAVCVFVGRDETGKERFACMRGISSDLKQDAAGSNKSYSFHLPAKNLDSHHLAVFESPIDALSHATIGQREGWQWNGHRLSLGGTSNVALMAFLERNPQIARIALSLDNDEAGRTAAANIQTQLAEDARFAHIRVSINPPSAGSKDWNDALLHTVKLEREHKQQSRSDKGAAISI